MPSPFPGMDPYLEKRSLWPDFHSSFITYIREHLQEQIRPKYNARIEERIHLIQPPHNYYPDLSIIRPPRAEGALVVAEKSIVADNPYLVEMLESEFREPYIEIVYLPTGEVVTTIELLSPINKTGEGQQGDRVQQPQTMSRSANLVEVDLLRAGNRTVAVPENGLRGATKGSQPAVKGGSKPLIC